jgi:cytochrome b pre-mRNA-processing protein 3
MIPPLFRRLPKRTIAALYGTIVAQARNPNFYAAYGVPDTVLGRFDMIVLHVALLVRRLREGDKATRALAQGVFDAFCLDMDHNLREMGISDQGVPRQMRRVGEAFYGRAQAYEAALAADGDGVLADTLARNVYAEAREPAIAAASLAAYVRLAVRMLAGQALDGLARGEARFPDPGAAVVAESTVAAE